MPPKAAPAGGPKMFSADVVAAVLCSTGTTSLSSKNYEMMSALDSKKTVSAFQHDFRSVLAKAKELKARVEHGEVFEPVPPGSARKSEAPATPKKRKGTSSDSDSDSTPSKKRAAAKKKATTPKSAKKNSSPPLDDEELPHDAEKFIKAEREWEDRLEFA